MLIIAPNFTIFYLHIKKDIGRVVQARYVVLMSKRCLLPAYLPPLHIMLYVLVEVCWETSGYHHVIFVLVEGYWESSEYDTVTLTSASAPVNKLLPVAGKLWCAANNDIIVVNPTSLEPEVSDLLPKLVLYIYVKFRFSIIIRIG